MEAGAAIRTARAGVFAALLLTLSAGGHILLTGTPLPMAVVAAAGVAVFGVAMLLPVVECRFGAIAAVLVPLELTLNALYNVGQSNCQSGTSGTSTGLLPDLLCGGSPVRGLGPVLDQPAVPGQLTTTQLLLVLFLHLAAALTAAIWLRLGEKAVFRTLSALAAPALRPVRILLAWLLTAGPAPVGPLVVLPEQDHPKPKDVLRRAVQRRGPPALVPAA
ncbi:hypothetical protein LN042_28580 [Kitasatospora sp. RB6PN24]|uniref:hypothetical protein n=1 Tax=Kitasatospora humi TaxID=2893891 RepID=UPI001E290AD4|nr:hypothetical protein [Kitasatospora humi]MCC9310979.1 hypothetical protein [Kitasatospora humi]